ncbi:CCA tRNA nucleotidyltransferase [uncultured Cohaesibacter sp.]|uniref:CCA tRNA nucleotidyltransferase n=1 Tax=uncultured Cohaesibacter sp. TaxID=1002546 RepID=UPI00293010C6|nr:CCA tRNA nucleotidyltransferase [uncultured Cohaesibacter sp.]
MRWTSLRADVETDGRHAEVAFGKNWQEDALRRDFTMNALYLDEGGRLYDPTGKGIADAKERRVRFIGQASQRIAEDYLRILRFFRFFAQYGRAFDQQDYFACVAAQKQLSTLSAERVGAEMVKLVTGRFAYGALEAMHKGGMLTSILGSVPHISRFARLQRLAKRLYMSPDINLLFAALAVDVREDAARLARVLRLPNRSRDHMMRMAQNVRTIRDVSEDLLQKLAYEHSKETACDLVLLAVVRRQLAPDLTDLSMQMRNLELWQMPVFPLNGRDLLDRGMKPGPNVGCRLAQLERAWVNSGFELSKRELLSKAYLRR